MCGGTGNPSPTVRCEVRQNCRGGHWPSVKVADYAMLQARYGRAMLAPTRLCEEAVGGSSGTPTPTKTFCKGCGNGQNMIYFICLPRGILKIEKRKENESVFCLVI